MQLADSCTESNFKMPFYRDLIMSLGIASVSKQSCKNILSRGAGTAIAIVVGGATESLSAHPGTADLTLRRRFGFIKIAMREGADLVPVFGFGENDVRLIITMRSVLTIINCRYTTNCERQHVIAERKRADSQQSERQGVCCVQDSEELSAHIWVHPAAILR